MKLPSWLTKMLPVGPRLSQTSRGRVYHLSAATDRHNSNTWSPAITTDPDSAILPEIDLLRARSAYEVANNGTAKGIVNSYANDCIGSGPRVQIKSGYKAYDDDLEAGFHAWTGDGNDLEGGECDIAGEMVLSEILRMIVKMLIVKGEVFVHRGYIPSPGRSIKYRISVIPPEMIASPMGFLDGVQKDGTLVKAGIIYDTNGRPTKYLKLKEHPGNGLTGRLDMGYESLDAASVTHLSVADEAGQTRGKPWLTPSLSIFSQIREYSQYVLGAARFAAGISAVLETTDPMAQAIETDVEQFDTIEIERNMIMTLPNGKKINQFQPTQPTTTFNEFNESMINIAARPLSVPLNVALCNSSGYNYASGRLDHQTYHKELLVVRDWLVKRLLKPMINDYEREAALMGLLRAVSQVKRNRVKVSWMWPGFEHVDPQKEATATKTNLETQTTTLAAEYGRKGLDWEVELEQLAKEKAKKKELEKEYGITFDEPKKEKTNPAGPKADDGKADDESGDDGRSSHGLPRVSVSA